MSKILINLGHTSATIQSIILCLTKYSKDDCYLLIVDNFNKTPNSYKGEYAKLIEKHIVKKIVYYDIIVGTKESSNNEEIIKGYFDDLFKNNEMKLIMFDEIIVSTDYVNNFLVYLEINNVNAKAMELSPNQFSNRAFAGKACSLGLCSDYYYKIQLKTGYMDGSTKECILISNDSTEIINSLNVNKTLKTMDYKSKRVIEDLFGVESIPDNSSILFMNSGSLGRVLRTLEFQIATLYQLLLDYFSTSKHILVKKHPDDNKDYMKETFDGCTYLNNYPAELLVMKNIKFKQVFTIASTSVEKIESEMEIEDIIKLPNFFFYYYNIPALYESFVFLDSIGMKYNVSYSIFDDVAIKKFHQNNTSSQTILITFDDTLSLESIRKYEICIILQNTMNIGNSLYKLNGLNGHLYLFGLEKIKTSPYTLSSEFNDKFIVYSKNKLPVDVLNYRTYRKLTNLKIELLTKIINYFDLNSTTFTKNTLQFPFFDMEFLSSMGEIRNKNLENIECQFAIANRYFYGVGLEKNIDLAIRWITISSNAGVTTATYKLCQYLIARGGSLDIKKAFDLAISKIKEGEYMFYLILSALYRKRNMADSVKLLKSAISHHVPSSKKEYNMIKGILKN